MEIYRTSRKFCSDSLEQNCFYCQSQNAPEDLISEEGEEVEDECEDLVTQTTERPRPDVMSDKFGSSKRGRGYCSTKQGERIRSTLGLIQSPGPVNHHRSPKIP